MTFAGFPSRGQATAIPNAFFSDVLPKLAGDATALGVTLYAFNALLRRRGFPRYLTAAELTAEPAVAAYLAGAASLAEEVERGLERAAEVGVLRALAVHDGETRRTLYFLNTPADRRGLEAVRAGRIEPLRVAPEPAAGAARSGVFALYESLVGTISPLIAEELTEAERLYPAAWLEAAFREAAAQNARSWRYVSRILERWATEGPDYATTERDPAGGDRYLSGRYGRVLKQRLGR